MIKSSGAAFFDRFTLGRFESTHSTLLDTSIPFAVIVI